MEFLQIIRVQGTKFFRAAIGDNVPLLLCCDKDHSRYSYLSVVFSINLSINQLKLIGGLFL